MTGWAVLGLEAAGINPLDLDHGDATPISYLAGTVGEISTTGDIERTILLLRGAGLDPRHFQGHDLVSRLLARRGGDGSWGAAGEPDRLRDPRPAGRRRRPPATRRSAAWLRGAPELRTAAGASPPRRASDADSTGAVLQALAASGSRAGIRRGVLYLRGVQRLRRRLRRSTGGAINAQSTAWAVAGPGRGGRLAVVGPEGRPLPARLPGLRPGRATATTATRPRATRRRSG